MRGFPTCPPPSEPGCRLAAEHAQVIRQELSLQARIAADSKLKFG
jgi:hypothetical protein